MSRSGRRRGPAGPSPESLKVIGGRLRGSHLLRPPGEVTRPMKGRVREAVFNLLGPGLEGMLALDLFAGSGAMGIEALSRGAAEALFVERHFGCADVIRENLRRLQLSEKGRIVAADVFFWSRTPPDDPRPWLVFCCPPYDLFQTRGGDLCQLVDRLIQAAPAGSRLVVESDVRFDPSDLPTTDWDVRDYPPARVAVSG